MISKEQLIMFLILSVDIPCYELFNEKGVFNNGRSRANTTRVPPGSAAILSSRPDGTPA
jgi:hypothetical protein